MEMGDGGDDENNEMDSEPSGASGESWLGRADDFVNNLFSDGLGTFIEDKSVVGKVYHTVDDKLKNKGTDPYDGPDGFKNNGWPTMKLTFGVLGTFFSGGATFTYLSSAGATTAGAIYSSTTLSLNTYSTVDQGLQMINEKSLPFSKGVDNTNIFIDMIESMQGNPISIMNMAIYMSNLKINQKR